MIRVLIADQARFICGFIRTILEQEDDFYVIGSAAKVDELHFLLPHCNVALINIRFNGNETINLFREMHAKYARIKCLAIGMPDMPAQIVRFIEAGTAGYVLENESTDDLVHKVRAAVNGKAVVSGKVAAVMMKHINNLASAPPSLHNKNKKEDHMALLTIRQREVMDLVSQGLTNKEIAKKLYIECGTVKNHLHHILKKIGASNRHEAASIYQTHYHENGFTNEGYYRAA